MEWASASGQPDETKFEKFFGTSTLPTGNYLITESDNAAGIADKAEFQSCLLQCSADDPCSSSTPAVATTVPGPNLAECQKVACNFNDADQSKFAASYLKPGEKSSMEVSSDLFADSDKQVKFQEYKATEGITTKACCDSIDNCPYETGSLVRKEDFRQWYQGDNRNSNEGGVGIDNIQVFDASGAQQIC
uniref:Uncharacterized protein n=1 Tax=Romanomermis culicivorax TaxID=13658 RepID=A0A915JVX7_ROMCU